MHVRVLRIKRAMYGHRACRALGEVMPWRCVSTRGVFSSTHLADSERLERSERSERLERLERAEDDDDDPRGVLAVLGSLATLVRRSGAVVPAVVKTPAVLEKAVSDLQREVVQDHPKRFRLLGKSLVQSLKMKSIWFVRQDNA